MQNLDFDFIGFTYNGKHSVRDLGIYRVSNSSNRYEEVFVPSMKEITASVPGQQGQYFFGTTIENKTFTIAFAFQDLTEKKIKEMKKTLNGDGIHDLIFDETPYKVYSAKITGKPTLKYLCFEKNGQRYYNGEGNLQFTCYFPYAHSPRNLQNPALLESPTINFGGYEKVFFNGMTQYKNMLNNILELDCGLTIFNSTSISLTIPKYCIDSVVLYCFDSSGKSKIFTKKPAESSAEQITISFGEQPTDLYISSVKYVLRVVFPASEATDWNGLSSYVPQIKPTIKGATTYNYYLKNGIGCFLCPRADEAGKCVNCYHLADYPTKKQWTWGCDLETHPTSENKGEREVPFQVSFKNIDTAQSTKCTLIVDETDGLEEWAKIIVTVPPNCKVVWDSKTALVYAIASDGKKTVLDASGDLCATIPPGKTAGISGISTVANCITELKLNYDYWYY